MAKRKVKKHKKAKKYFKLIIPAILLVALFVLLFFLYWQISLVPQHSIYVSSDNPSQGDTILVKVNGEYPLVTGSFNGDSIDFFKSGIHSDWTAFLGIDVNLAPGKYKILVNARTDSSDLAKGEKMEKEINVGKKDFLSIGLVPTKEQESKGFTSAKVEDNIIKKDNPILKQVLEKNTPTPYFKDSFTFPLSNMQVSGLDFGELIKGQGYENRHLGVDLRATTGTKVYSINTGKVVLVKDLSNYGKTIVIDHGLGIFSLYLHLDKYEVSEGDNVKKDQVVGLSGNSGYSTAPHLHFSIRDNNAKIDPISFIKATQQSDDSFNLANIEKAFSKIFNRY